MIKQFIDSIREERDGFVLDKPWRLDESSVGVIIPIKRNKKAKRGYITFPEAENIKVEDTGQIDYVYIKNMEDKPVLISRGEIFRGKTQERAAIHDHLIKAKSGLRVAVRCVHASKGINSGTDMKYGGRVPYDIDLSNQSRTWQTVNCYSTNVARSGSIGVSSPGIPFSNSDYSNLYNTGRFGGMSMNIGANMNSRLYGSNAGDQSTPNIQASDDLVSTLDNLSDAMKEALKKIPFIENQVGAIFYKENSLLGMDVYDLPKSWENIKKDVVEKEGSNFLEKDEDNLFEFKPEKAKKLVNKHLGVEFTEKVLYDRDYKLIEIQTNDLIGEGIIYNDKVIHLTLWKRFNK